MLKDSHLKDFFESGFYETYWGWKFKEDDSKKLAEDSLRLLGASHGQILDWCGGWGRVSIHFAKRGFKVTILDFVEEYLERAKKTFRKERLDVDTILADCRNTPSSIQADYATCFFNSVLQ